MSLTSILYFLHAQRHIQKVTPDWRSLLFTCAAPHTKSKGLPIDTPYTYLMLFTWAALHTKSKELMINVHYIYLMLFTCAMPHTKSKGLLIDVPNWLLFNIFCTCLVNRSRLMYHRTFHTHQSSVYEKQGASIYLYPSGIQWDQINFL
jgi:hypothetical protein